MGRRIDPLEEKHFEAIRLLTSVSRMNHEQIARKLRISRMTLYRWRQRTDFDRALRKEIDNYVKSRVQRNKLRISSYDAETLEFTLRSCGLLA